MSAFFHNEWRISTTRVEITCYTNSPLVIHMRHNPYISVNVNKVLYNLSEMTHNTNSWSNPDHDPSQGQSCLWQHTSLPCVQD
jgi:hypothetical protein